MNSSIFPVIFYTPYRIASRYSLINPASVQGNSLTVVVGPQVGLVTTVTSHWAGTMFDPQTVTMSNFQIIIVWQDDRTVAVIDPQPIAMTFSCWWSGFRHCGSQPSGWSGNRETQQGKWKRTSCAAASSPSWDCGDNNNFHHGSHGEYYPSDAGSPDQSSQRSERKGEKQGDLSQLPSLAVPAFSSGAASAAAMPTALTMVVSSTVGWWSVCLVPFTFSTQSLFPVLMEGN